MTHYLTRKTPVYDEKGQVIGLLGVSLDMTERKLLEEELIKAKEVAEAANRAKTEFLGNVSHDVKSPLAAISILAESLLEKLNEPKLKQDLKTILSCQNRLSKFFENCLENANVELKGAALVQKRVSLKNMLTELYDIFIVEAQRKELKFEIHLAEELPDQILACDTMLYRVILNLIGSVIKFTKIGQVTVTAFIAEHLSVDKLKLGIEVKDTGQGIPENEREIIFKKLHRLSQSYEEKIEGSGCWIIYR